MTDTVSWAATSDVAMTFTHTAICPDLLRYEQIGEADNFRGRVVRAFFWLLDRVMPVPSS